jgi:hypothetical protein
MMTSTVDYLSKPALITEMKRMMQLNVMPIKGTYVKTMPDDIFDEPVNKTTELHQINVGNQKILVPIVQEEEEAQGAIPDDLLNSVLAKIKDKKSRRIFQEYIAQQKDIKAEPIVVKEKVTLDESEMKRQKDDYVARMKEIRTMDELQDFMKEEKISAFLRDLKDFGFQYTLASFNRSFTAAKNRLTKQKAQTEFKEAQETKKLEEKAATIEEIKQQRKEKAAQKKLLKQEAVMKKKEEKLRLEKEREEKEEAERKRHEELAEKQRLEAEKQKEKKKRKPRTRAAAKAAAEAGEEDSSEDEETKTVRALKEKQVATIVELGRFLNALDNAKFKTKKGFEAFLKKENFEDLSDALEQLGLKQRHAALTKAIAEVAKRFT